MAQQRRYESDAGRDETWSGDWQDWESAEGGDHGRGRGSTPREFRNGRPLYGSGASGGIGRGYGYGGYRDERFPSDDYGAASRESRRGEYGRGMRGDLPGGDWRGSDWPRRGSNFSRDDYGAGYDDRRGSRFEHPSQAWHGRHGRPYDADPRRGHFGRMDEERSWWDRASDEVSSWFGDEAAERRRDMDEFRGRGPKNYTRSDDRIREDVCDRLADAWSIDASDIEVGVEGSEVTLSGTVSDRRQRRAAEDCAEEISGVRHVQNNLRVKESTPDSGGGSAGSRLTGSSF